VGSLKGVPHLVVEPDITGKLVGQATQSTRHWCVGEGTAKAVADSRPDQTPNGEANEVEGDSKYTSKSGFHGIKGMKEHNTREALVNAYEFTADITQRSIVHPFH